MHAHKVIWQEGMLLRPQHLQHNDRYHDHQLKARTQLLGSYTWGFLSLEVDLQFLNMGKLVINRASGILPDGSYFDAGGSTRPLALDVPANTGSKPIYLALPLVSANHIDHAARSSPMCWRVTSPMKWRLPTPMPVTVVPPKSAAPVRISAYCWVIRETIRPV